MIEEIKQQFEDLSNDYNSLKGEVKILKENLTDREERLVEQKESLENHLKAVEILTAVQKVTKEKIKDGFENIVTHALQYFFGKGKYRFVLEFGKRGNLQELYFKVIKDDICNSLDTLEGNGGGLFDAISLALRFVLLELTIPKNKGFVILDEPFKWVSAEFQENASKFLQEVNQKMDRQIILITHKSLFIENADKEIEIK